MASIVDTSGQEVASSEHEPWWATFTKQIGIPAAIALFLVWTVVRLLIGDLTGLHADMTSMLANVNSLNAALAAHQAQMSLDAAAAQKSRDVSEHLLLVICSNSAKDQTQRNACFGR